MNKPLFIYLVAASFFIAVNADGYDSDSDEFECSEVGKFADVDDNTCKCYYVCTPGYDGELIRYRSSCPDGKLFDPNTGHCSTTATCKPYHEESEEAEESEEYYDEDEYKCKRAGTHDNPSDPYCTKYIECVKTHSGLYPVSRTCPSPYKYNPKLGECSNRYTCPRKFRCTKPGRFPNGNDLHGSKYFLCSRLKNGEYIQTGYTCPPKTIFSAEIEMCMFSDKRDAYHDHTLPIENWGHLNSDHFECVRRGYAPSKTDKTNRMHYFCDVNSIGELYMNILVCRAGQEFCPDTNLCKVV